MASSQQGLHPQKSLLRQKQKQLLRKPTCQQLGLLCYLVPGCCFEQAPADPQLCSAGKSSLIRLLQRKPSRSGCRPCRTDWQHGRPLNSTHLDSFVVCHHSPHKTCVIWRSLMESRQVLPEVFLSLLLVPACAAQQSNRAACHPLPASRSADRAPITVLCIVINAVHQHTARMQQFRFQTLQVRQAWVLDHRNTKRLLAAAGNAHAVITSWRTTT